MLRVSERTRYIWAKSTTKEVDTCVIELRYLLALYFVVPGPVERLLIIE